MIWMKIKTIELEERTVYCAECRFNNNSNTFSYYSVDHETKKGFTDRVMATIRNEFRIKPEVI